MNVLSLFSGAGGLDLGLEAAGHTIVAQCEIDPTARQVLRRHWPDTHLHDDVTTFDPEEFRGRVDLVAGGSPCQDLSVAGRRGGLDGERSGLFWHQCRIADSVAAPWVLWENVAGAFSSNGGADFAAVLWGLTGALPRVPDGGWRTAGVVVGPKRTAVWRLLDARWFGVAQRRRRVFVVAGPRDECGPQVLLEPEGLRGNPAPGREAGQEVAGTLGTSPIKRPDDLDGHGSHVIVAADGHQVAAPLGSQPQAVSENQRGEVLLTPYSRQLTTGGGKPGQGYPCVAVPLHRASVGRSDSAGPAGPPFGNPGDPSFTLDTVSRHGVAVPIATRDRADGAELELGEPDIYNALRAGDGGSSRSQHVLTPDIEVRRLTPRECERLMGWPDDHTRWTDTGQEIADSHRYRMCGNGVVAPVAEWIGRRLP